MEERDLRFGYVSDLLGILCPLGTHTHLDGDRSTAEPRSLGVQAQHIAHGDRLMELDLTEGHGDVPGGRLANRLDVGSLVDQRENHAAEDASQAVGVARHHHHANGRLACWRFGFMAHVLIGSESKTKRFAIRRLV